MLSSTIFHINIIFVTMLYIYKQHLLNNIKYLFNVCNVPVSSTFTLIVIHIDYL